MHLNFQQIHFWNLRNMYQVGDLGDIKYTVVLINKLVLKDYSESRLLYTKHC
jgi:hypothetical protein